MFQRIIVTIISIIVIVITFGKNFIKDLLYVNLMAVISKLCTFTVFVIVDLVEIVSLGSEDLNQLSVKSHGCER
jgi:archaellum biogenesis protein FlaJ (TadC family)